MNGLRAQFLESVPSDDGPQADVLLIEPNGDPYRVRCLCRHNGRTDIGGDHEELLYLNGRYGDQAVCGAARAVTLG